MKYSLTFLFCLTCNLYFSQVRIMMEKVGGVYLVPCKVNGVPLDFIFDTGASDVSISLSEAIFMIKNNYISKEDIGDTVYFSIANGDVAKGTRLNIKEIEIGGLKINNVSASIVHELGSPLLLGQSLIEKLGKIQINKSELLIFNDHSTTNDKNNLKIQTSPIRKDAYETEMLYDSPKYLELKNANLEGNWVLSNVEIYKPDELNINNIFDLATVPECLENSIWSLNSRYNGSIRLQNNSCTSTIKQIKWEIVKGEFFFKYKIKNNSMGYSLKITDIDSSSFQLTQRIPNSFKTIYVIYKFMRN